jgi:hypothetical protein
MTYTYREVDRGSVERSDVRLAESIVERARRLFELGPLPIRWWVTDDNAEGWWPTRWGCRTDLEDRKHLSGWFSASPVHISIRADQPTRTIAATALHELWHAVQHAAGKPLDEEAAELFSRTVMEKEFPR